MNGKLYDAYVRFLHPDTLTSDVTANFALQILPKEMEKHGYSLFIRGRDDCPGEGSVDYRCLPESLRYIKRKQGALKWKKPSLKTNKCIKFRSNRNFWKSLRYNMPSVPSGKLHTIV
ncbi:hypothetical protein NQZ68_034518 [Dissostichus eleginoides]|nr:hypothetical protein NQZ68_034518 [Dissostichus eleginoides]